MFKFLKEKLSGAISRISEKILHKEEAEAPKEEAKQEIIEEKLPDAWPIEIARHETAEEKPKAQKEEPKKEPDAEKLTEARPVLQKTEPKHEHKHDKKEKHEDKHKIKPIEKPIQTTAKESKTREKITAQEAYQPPVQERPKAREQPAEEVHEKKGFFTRLKESITTTKITGSEFEELFGELELALLENNAAVEIIDKIKEDLKEAIVDKPIRRSNIEESIGNALKESITGLFSSSGFDIVQEIRKKAEKPYVIVFFGINGSGKTTSIAKIASMLKENRMDCVIAAADTFRAASIEQLQIHGDKLNVKVIKHDYGSDPAAVAFDAIKHAKSRNADVVLIDTAGRMHSNKNLLKEMEKIVRVAKPDLKIFVGESITGNDCVEQAKAFNESLGIDGIILSKLDVDEKGGAAVSVSYATKKPILYFGTGQEYKDLKKFEAEMVVKNLGLA
ncbi:signal recognition particle-docking protein FtsY [Candidatus Woesearchaeota archaeon]|nr:signal recognition particle-docking protein FtsY [Candidatus Woesearchaeota archaeon]